MRDITENQSYDNAHNINCMTKGFIQDSNVPPITWDNKQNDDENKISPLSFMKDKGLTMLDVPSYHETLTRFSSGSYTIAGFGYANSILWFQGNVTKSQAREWLEMNIMNIVPEELRDC